MPRVLHVLASNDRRGAEVFAVDLAAALAPLGWESTVVSVSSSSSEATVPAQPLGEALRISVLWRLRKAAQQHDVVIAHGSSSLKACAFACAGAAPFVYRSIGDPAYWSADGVRRRLTTWLLNRSKTVVALFPGAVDELRSRGVRAALEVIPNAVPAERFPSVTPAARDAARRDLGLDPGATVVLYLGALSSEKRPERALDLAERRPGLSVLVVGDGPLRSALDERARRLPNVRVLGPTTEPQRVLHTADVVVVPSDTEGIPAVAVEAGLSGLPVVASDVGGLSTLVDHGTTGLLVPARDDEAFVEAVDAALADRAAMGRAARERCLQHFDIDPVARRWAEVISAAARPTTGT
jgi:glycosyltransferase involved in cell wall biosynthesis